MSQTLSLAEIYAPVEKQLGCVHETILDILKTPNLLAGDVIRYFFSGQGKLLRPALAFLGAGLSASGGTDKESRLLRVASAFEIFHAATLIHDDIIDSAYLRRNLPTVNIKWGPEVAVLVGDLLHDKAIAAIFRNGRENVISRFLETAGIVCDGEIHELKEKGNMELTEESYVEIIDKKTAALLACCVESGGLMNGCTQPEAEALRRFGRWFGIAFQIVDDCLDFTGVENEFGKTLGADCAAGVLTLPLIRLIQTASGKKREEIVRLAASDGHAGKFKTLSGMIHDHETIAYSLDQARRYSEKARGELSIFPESPCRRSLEKLLDYVLERNK